MKKYVLVVLSLFLFTKISAQYEIVVHSQGNEIYEHATSKIDSIKWINGQSDFFTNDNANVSFPVSMIDSLTFRPIEPSILNSFNLIRLQRKTGQYNFDVAPYFGGGDLQFSITPQSSVYTISPNGQLDFDTNVDNGDYVISVTAYNTSGSVTQDLTIRVGPTIGVAIPLDRLAWESENTVRAYFQKVFNLGAYYVRFDFDWWDVWNDGNINPNYKNTLQICTIAMEEGLTPLLVWRFKPNWDNSFFNYFSANMTTIVPGILSSFSAAGVHYHELGNEVNLNSFMSVSVDYATFTNWHKATYTVIKSYDASAFVISTGLSPVPNPSSTPNARSAVPFLNAMYANGLYGDTDGIGFHPYSYPLFPQGTQNWNGWHIMRSHIRNVMLNWGDTTNKIWITEFGAPTNGVGNAISEADQVLNLTQGWDEMASFNWCETLFWYTLFDYEPYSNGSSASTEDYFGIYKSDDTTKPVINIFNNIFRGN